jgi:PAS domain S-box-containing protein
MVLHSEQHRNPLAPDPGADDRFRAIFEAVKDGIFISDPATGRFVEVNGPGCTMFGYDKDEIIGGDIGLLSSGIGPYTLEGAIETARKAALGEPQLLEWQCKAKDGVLFWTEISIKYTEIGHIPSIVAIVRDISERKRLDEELKLALQNMSAANDAKSMFLATMSHELRTPLNAIIGFTDLMLTQMLGPLGHPKYREYIGDVHKSGRHLLALINDVLDLSRLDAGKTEIADEDVSLRQVVGEACRIVGNQATQANLQIVTSLPAGLRDVRGDERRIKQIVLNLLSNAIKFTPAGGSVTVKAGETATGLVLQVCDTGIGISEADMPTVLERFGQVDSKISRKYEGTGLGLPLAKQLIELHGGSLRIESKVNAGTVVSITFPPERIVRSESRQFG